MAQTPVFVDELRAVADVLEAVASSAMASGEQRGGGAAGAALRANQPLQLSELANFKPLEKLEP